MSAGRPAGATAARVPPLMSAQWEDLSQRPPGSSCTTTIAAGLRRGELAIVCHTQGLFLSAENLHFP